jgi:hypothetical protein
MFTDVVLMHGHEVPFSIYISCFFSQESGWHVILAYGHFLRHVAQLIIHCLATI